MKTWVIERQPEMVKVPIDPKQYKEKLAEIAEILYHYLASSPKLVPAYNPARLKLAHDSGFNPEESHD